MKAYRIHSLHNIGLDEMDAQPVGENCVKLKTLVCGISSSDISVYRGNIPVQYPLIPGRQCVGFVSEIGAAVKGLSRGNRVVVYPQASCHSCNACKDDRYYDCEKPNVFGVAENGFLSDFSVVSADDVYAIPDRLKDEEAVYTEHTALAINVLSRLNMNKGEHLVIVGATAVGKILAQVAMYYQIVPIMVDMREDMLAIAQKTGVYYTVNSVSDDVSKKILALTGGHMANACAYLVSSTMPLQNVVDYTAKRGKIALVGRLGDEELKCSLNGLIEKSIDIVTVTDCGKNYPSAINMLANRTVSVDLLPKRIVPFSDVTAEFEKLGTDNERRGEKIIVKV